MNRDEVSFGRFQLNLSERKLSRGEVPVQLGSRALEILCVLASAKGEVVTKNELMARVWPGLVVEENNIQVHVSALRKALDEGKSGENYLVTVPGRGYRLIGLHAGHLSASESKPPRDPVLPDKPSIAVLPFQNMSSDAEQEYFADGIVEDITTALTRFPSLFVIARNSSFSYKGRAVDIRRVGRELGVRYVLEGSVRKAGNRLRISGQLVQAETGVHVWAERYDRDLGEIFSLQDEMAASIVGALVPSLQRAEIDRARLKPPESPDAYDLYLRALAAFYTWTEEGNDHALRLLEKAFAVDPHFAPAMILAANCWTLRYNHSWSPTEEAIAESLRYVRLAVQIDPDNAAALALLAQRTASHTHNYDEAISLAERAVAINPNSASALAHSGWAFVYCGLPEKALMHFEGAMRLSPRDSGTYASLAGKALALIQLERDLEAIATARKGIQHNPSHVAPWRMLTASLALAGQLEEAGTALRWLLNLDPSCSLKTIYLRFGHSEKARARYFEGLRKAGMPE